MGKFPNAESETVALASSMMTGLSENPDTYPDPPLPQIALGPLLSAYSMARHAVTSARADAEAAVAAKNEALANLVAGMKKDLRYAENKVDFNNEKLALLGWSGRKIPEPVPAPGTPTNLTPVIQGTGSVIFEWRASTDPLTGPTKTYVVERRDFVDGEFTEWQKVGFSMEEELTLTEQPQGIKLEYRVTATNRNGESGSSNSTAVVL